MGTDRETPPVERDNGVVSGSLVRGRSLKHRGGSGHGSRESRLVSPSSSSSSGGTAEGIGSPHSSHRSMSGGLTTSTNVSSVGAAITFLHIARYPRCFLRGRGGKM